jgi:hypothetical protein
MSALPENRIAREAVGIFADPAHLQDAIDELLSSGFHRAALSLLAGERTVQEKLGHHYRKIEELPDDPNVPRSAYVSTEAIGDLEGGLIGVLTYVGATAAAGAVVVSGGTLAAIITGAALAGGASGLLGSVLAKWVGEHHAHYLQEQVDHGGLLLWVRTWDADAEARATTILKKHSGRGVHVHPLPSDS